MKIRIEGNSVRLRLGKSEVSRLAASNRVEGAAHFPNGCFRYRLELLSGLLGMAARFDAEGITVSLPEAWGKGWPEDSRVGFEERIPLEGGESLHLLVEKDFICLDRDPGGQQDQYPHPKMEKK